MDFQEVRGAVLAAIRGAGGEMPYQAFQDSLPPVAQLSLPRHLDQMRVAGDITLSVRFDAKTVTTDLFISVQKVEGA